MRRALEISLALHLLAGLAWFAWPRPVPVTPPEAEAEIEVVFGKSARSEGAPPPAAAPTNAPAAASPAVAASAASAPSPHADSGAEAPSLPAAAATGAASAAGASPGAGALHFAPVRLGEGVVGFDVKERDPGLVAAQGDPGNRPPVYPEDASARHEEGMTVLGIHVGPDGRVASIDLVRSSGHPSLDAAARAAALKWRFVPQLRDGVPVPSYREQAFNFVL